MNQLNMGNVNCTCCGYYIPRGSVKGYNQSDYRGEYYLLGSGTVTQTEWTPNRLTYEIDTPAATTLIINQNLYPGWRLTVGTGTVYAYDGRIAVRVPQGRQKVQLLYRPRHIAWAFLITSLAFVTLIGMWLIETGVLPEPRRTWHRRVLAASSSAITIDPDMPYSKGD
jgi:hypothetical protein